MRSIKAVHISTVHHSMDPRIRLKQLAFIAQAGHEAVFVTGDQDARLLDDRVNIEVVPFARGNRLARILLAGLLATLKARSLKADVYHLHDPELLLWAWLLAGRAGVIVYDVHEDYVTALGQKRYLSLAVRSLLGRIIGALEDRLSRSTHRVIAEKYYAERFPDATPILNYPEVDLVSEESCFSASSRKVIYTGNVTIERGAENLARLVAESSDYDVVVVGKCDQAVFDRMQELAGPGSSRLEVEGLERFVPFSAIQTRCQSEKWLAGLALFPDSDHYRKKELTKFFEYMAIGIPLVISNFEPWQRFVRDYGVGICVDPTDMRAVTGALRWLKDHPGDAEEMGVRGRELVKNELNWQSEGRKLIDFYESRMG